MADTTRRSRGAGPGSGRIARHGNRSDDTSAVRQEWASYVRRIRLRTGEPGPVEMELRAKYELFGRGGISACDCPGCRKWHRDERRCA